MEKTFAFSFQHWNYGTGDVGNDGVHQMDIARWSLGADTPSRVTGMAKKVFFDDDQQTPDTANITFDFGGKLLQFEMRIWNSYGMEGQENGVSVYGSSGMIQIGRWNKEWGYRVYNGDGKLEIDESNGRDGNEVHHFQNFFQAMRDRKGLHAEIETGHKSTILCHLANIVAKTGRNLTFDGVKEQIVNDAEASRYLRREYRKHWAMPQGV
ncbi:MAG: hypothetical protein HYZ37_06850 [Candidatus Solibacter usitatus]|nr:hypothetical protein [Candidatus Solibacter usitatus]